MSGRQNKSATKHARGRRTREEVLESAARAIRLDGVASLSVGRVMRAAGKTHGGFYCHFGSKDELASAAVERLLCAPLRLFERWAEASDPQAGVASYVGYYLSPAHRDARDRGCPMSALMSDLPRMVPASREAVDREVRRLARAIEARLDPVGAEASLNTLTAIAEMIGVLALARAVSDQALSTELLDGARACVLAKLGLERLGEVAEAAAGLGPRSAE